MAKLTKPTKVTNLPTWLGAMTSGAYVTTADLIALGCIQSSENLYDGKLRDAHGERVAVETDMHTVIDALYGEIKKKASKDDLANIDLSTKADLVGGKVPSSQLPSYVDDVVNFQGKITSAPAATDDTKVTTDSLGTDTWTAVWYPGSVNVSTGLHENARFYLVKTVDGTSTYYTSWDDAVAQQLGIPYYSTPQTGKIYVDTTVDEGGVYRWSGDVLLEISKANDNAVVKIDDFTFDNSGYIGSDYPAYEFSYSTVGVGSKTAKIAYANYQYANNDITNRYSGVMGCEMINRLAYLNEWYEG